MFDRVIVVDWSASSTPKRGRDSIWIAEFDRTGGCVATNPATRAAASTLLTERLQDNAMRTTLLAVDFSLGYPAGTAAALGLTGVPWSSMWAMLADRIVDHDDNANNRFAVAAGLNDRITGDAAPFWGCPPSRCAPTLSPRKPSLTGDVAEWRTVESVLRTAGRRPFSCWQLLGAGAVGSQTLLGIPVLARLRTSVEGCVEVWPFTTGFARPRFQGRGGVVLAEVWPSLLDIDHGDMVRDEAQVRATAAWLAEADRIGDLDALFAPAMQPADATAAIGEEGWVLGVTR